MKKLRIQRLDLIKRLKSKKGVTLVETLATILVFTVLVAAVATMISASLRITRLYFQRATEYQENANDAMLGEEIQLRPNRTPASVPMLTEAPGVLTISGAGIDEITIPVIILQDGTLVAFRPTEEPDHD